MFVDLLDELFVDLGELGVEGVDLCVETGEGLLIWKFFVEVGDRVEVDLVKFWSFNVHSNIIIKMNHITRGKC